MHGWHYLGTVAWRTQGSRVFVRLFSYSGRPCSPGRPLAACGGNLWAAAHSEESSEPAPACGAAESGSHSAPPSAQKHQAQQRVMILN